MRATSQPESHTYYLNWEVQMAAKKIVSEIMHTKPGETVVITSDTSTDRRVVEATAAAVMEAGAYPTVLQFPSSLEKMIMIEPKPPVAEAIKNCDVWIDFQYQLFYTKAWKAAMDAGVRLFLAAACDVDMIINVIGRINYPVLVKLGDRICELINSGKEMRITSEAGTDLVCSCVGRTAMQSGAYGTEKGTSVMLGGQTTFCAVEETINGTIVFDGGLFPPEQIGKQVSPVTLLIEKGICTDIIGDNRETLLFRKWMESFDDEKMYWLAHISNGFNPGVPEPKGRIAEDERIFGCVEIGFGTQGTGLGGPGWAAKEHTDGVILNPSIYIDGVAIEENGFYVEPELVRLCKELKVAGY
ncbi:MAG: hypothetical protein FWC66_05985 [Oscillospiraceae bacterium]|nr:hypothetical protein [Oscillospiraceae bacterium]